MLSLISAENTTNQNSLTQVFQGFQQYHRFLLDRLNFAFLSKHLMDIFDCLLFSLNDYMEF